MKNANKMTILNGVCNMSINKLTKRQQVEQWLKNSRSIDCSESVLEEIFALTMNHNKNNPHLTLKQSYSYACIIYINDKYTERKKYFSEIAEHIKE